jgi:hypothetical protein
MRINLSLFIVLLNHLRINYRSYLRLLVGGCWLVLLWWCRGFKGRRLAWLRFEGELFWGLLLWIFIGFVGGVFRWFMRGIILVLPVIGFRLRLFLHCLYLCFLTIGLFLAGTSFHIELILLFKWIDLFLITVICWELSDYWLFN